MQQAEWEKWLRDRLFEHVPCCIAIIDRHYNIVENNSAFRTVFGEGKGRKCYQIYKGGTERCSDCMAAHTFADGIPRVNDEVGIDHMGRTAHYLVHVIPITSADGSIPYVVELSTDVTEIKRVQREYQMLFERVPCFGMVVNRDLRIVRANERLREVFGECTGERCYKILKHRWEKCDDCPAEQTFADGQSHTSNQVGINKHGERTDYLVNTSPLLTGNRHITHVIEMALDLTETRKLEHQLAREHFLRESLIENSIDGVVALDPEGNVLIFNPAAESILKYSAADLLNRQPPDSFFPREFLRVMKSKDGACVLPETTIPARDGEPIPVRFSGVALKQADEFIGSAAFLQDLREIKQLEQEKIEAERFAAVGQTVAGLAHGIKNILTGLEGGMYVFNSGMQRDSRERIEQGWEMLNRNIERVSSLVKKLLSFSRGRAPEVKLTDPRRLLGEAVALFEDIASQQNIDLSAETDDEVAPAPLDPEAIHECLVNLISNAVDACKTSNNVPCSVVARCFDENGCLVFEVKDSGCGMDAETKRRIFTAFFTTKEKEGTGLGLLITRRIVQEHGGRIAIDSEPGKGSLFRLIFPRDKLPTLETTQPE